ncbi:hypothetical protein [Sphingobium aromaticiconvertens]|uniref:hypothetical protein n=1 Tax=Sphingobium aromaticiconvertens TaxID=365341 RepID=UPI0030183FD3
MPIESDILDRVTALLGRRELSLIEFTNWLGGAPDGGPDGDGYYPLSDSTGFTRLFPSPGALAETVLRKAFMTTAELTTVNIPPTAAYLQTDGYAATGDGGGATFRNVATDPATPGAFQSVDGRWWAYLPAGAIRPEQFGNVETGFTGALLAALTIADLFGLVVDLVPGKIYTLNASLMPVDLAIRLRGNGATILRADSMNGAIGFDIRYRFTDHKPVTSLATVNEAINSETTILTPVARIGVPDVSGYAVGDVVKIFSSTLISHGTREADGSTNRECYAEIIKIAKIDPVGNYLFGYAPLRIAPVANIRMVKLTRKPCVISDLTIADPVITPIPARTLPSRLVRITGAVAPELRNVTVPYVIGAAIQRDSCWQARSIGLRVEKAWTDFDQLQYGYALIDYACTDSRDWQLETGDVRHGYSTGALDSWGATDPAVTPPDVSDLDLQNYLNRFGGCVGCVVIGGVFNGPQNSGYDTHPDAIGCGAIASVVTQNYQGPTAAWFGYKLRGKDCFLLGCQSTGEGAIEMTIDGDGGGGFKVKGHVHNRPKGYDRQRVIVRATGRFNTDLPKITMDMDIYADTNSDYLFEIDHVALRFSQIDVDVGFNSVEFSRAGLFKLKNSATVNGDKLVADIARSSRATVPSSSSQASPHLILMDDPAGTMPGMSFHCDHVKLITDGASSALTWDIASGGNSDPGPAVGSINIDRIDSDWQASHAALGGFYHCPNLALARAPLRLAHGIGNQPWRRTLTYNAGGSIAETPWGANRWEQRLEFQARVNIAIGKTVTITTLPTFERQELLVVTTPNSIGVMNLNASAAMVLAAPIVFQPADAVMFIALESGSGLLWYPMRGY